MYTRLCVLMTLIVCRALCFIVARLCCGVWVVCVGAVRLVVTVLCFAVQTSLIIGVRIWSVLWCTCCRFRCCGVGGCAGLCCGVWLCCQFAVELVPWYVSWCSRGLQINAKHHELPDCVRMCWRPAKLLCSTRHASQIVRPRMLACCPFSKLPPVAHGQVKAYWTRN